MTNEEKVLKNLETILMVNRSTASLLKDHLEMLGMLHKRLIGLEDRVRVLEWVGKARLNELPPDGGAI